VEDAEPLLAWFDPEWKGYISYAGTCLFFDMFVRARIEAWRYLRAFEWIPTRVSIERVGLIGGSDGAVLVDDSFSTCAEFCDAIVRAPKFPEFQKKFLEERKKNVRSPVARSGSGLNVIANR
jgi:hypothetical protein